MTNYIQTQVAPIGGGMVSRTEDIVQRTVTYGDDIQYTTRYFWNCDTLTAIPNPGWVFDHWEASVHILYYDRIYDPSGKSPIIDETTYQPGNLPVVSVLRFTFDEQTLMPAPYGINSPGYFEQDAYNTAFGERWYYRPQQENYWTITAHFRQLSPSYTNLIVYDTNTNTIMRNVGLGNIILRDSP